MLFPERLFYFSLLAFSQFGKSNSANILFYNAVSSYSHRVAVWPWVGALAARGHNVTFLQPYPPKTPNPNVTEFYPKDLGDIWASPDETGKVLSDGGFLNTRLKGGTHWIDFHGLGFRSCEALLSNPEMTKFIESNKFDLVVIDFMYNECAYGLAHKWEAKTILYYSTFPGGCYSAEALGFTGTDDFEVPWHYAEGTLAERAVLFLWRAIHGVIYIILHLMKVWRFYPNLELVLRTKLNSPNMPSLQELVSESDLVLYNSHFSESPARILPPLFVAVPAMHAWDSTESKPSTKSKISKDMAKFIEESGDDGFIYISFGSLADINSAPREFQEVFIKTFVKSKTRFLWKIDGEITKEMPENVFTSPWMPQRDILSSSKCKGFISHGGLLGTQEAVLHGVPMIVMPLFGEQDYNGARIAEMGRGILLNANGLTADQLTEAVHQILTNQKYKENTQKISRQLKDQQNSPIDTAVYWTEYVLRHDREDLSRLKPLKWRYSYWFQVYYLDVWVFLLFLATITIYINFRIFRKIVLIVSARFTRNHKVKQS